MNKTNHPLEQEELMAYLDGELPADRAATAAAHLERCGDCQSVAADFQGVSRRLMAWQIESEGPGVGERLATALDERARQPKAARTWRALLGGRVSAWGLGLAGVSVALVLVVSLRYTGGPARWQVAPLPRYEQFSQLQAPPVKMTSATRRSTAVDMVVTRVPMIARTSQLNLT